MSNWDEEKLNLTETEVEGTLWQKTHFENGDFDVYTGPDATPGWVTAMGTEDRKADTWSAAYAERKTAEGQSYWQVGLARTPGDSYLPQAFTPYGPEGLKFDSEKSAAAAAKTLPDAVKQTTDTESTNNLTFDAQTGSFQYKEPAAAAPQA